MAGMARRAILAIAAALMAVAAEILAAAIATLAAGRSGHVVTEIGHIIGHASGLMVFHLLPAALAAAVMPMGRQPGDKRPALRLAVAGIIFAAMPAVIGWLTLANGAGLLVGGLSGGLAVALGAALDRAAGRPVPKPSIPKAAAPPLTPRATFGEKSQAGIAK